ncbi:MAG: excalibur calcium-binding domain-containing protein [Caldilineaceae bacterium]|nr:excalibur calcium-binding domain-containing protein [Caldilineaceae bacterium]
MNRKTGVGIVLVLVVLIILTASQLQAQGTLTLEGLAERFQLLTSDQDQLRERLAALEATAEAANVLAGITIREEHRCTPYSPSNYTYPDSLEVEILREMDGIYYSPYTAQTYTDAREVDIEHIVARSEAHDSGLCAADRFTRLTFASDQLNLTFAPPWLNRDVKGAKDLAEWLPDNNECWYANRVVAVKRKYGLSMDAKEAEVASRLLASCESYAMVRPQVTATPMASATVAAGTEADAGTPTPAADGGNNALALYDDDGNGRISCVEARAHDIAPVRSDHSAYQYMRDPDGDGVVCE